MRETIPFADKVRKDLILLGVKGATRDEVLTNIADILVEKGIAKPTFPAALLERESTYPTGLALGELNLAIPHANPEHINDITVTIAVPESPVIFQDMGDPDSDVSVSLIVCLTLQKADDNIKMLPALMSFFAQEENLRSILACTTPAQVMALLPKE